MEQAQSTGCLSSITVESVRNDFEYWRNNKTTHKIPDWGSIRSPRKCLTRPLMVSVISTTG